MEDPHANRLGARENDPVHMRVECERIADVTAAAGDVAEYAGWYTSISVDLVDLQSGPGRIRGRLEHHGVTGDQCRAGHPKTESGWEIERAIQAKTPYGRSVSMLVSMGVMRFISWMKPFIVHLVAIVVDQVRRLLGIADGFHLRFFPTSTLMMAAISNFRWRMIFAALRMIATRSCQGVSAQSRRAALAVATAWLTSSVDAAWKLRYDVRIDRRGCLRYAVRQR